MWRVEMSNQIFLVFGFVFFLFVFYFANKIRNKYYKDYVSKKDGYRCPKGFRPHPGDFRNPPRLFIKDWTKQNNL